MSDIERCWHLQTLINELYRIYKAGNLGSGAYEDLKKNADEATKILLSILKKEQDK
jgi:hypothetical protein